MQYHEAANIFPMMTTEELRKLSVNIKERGQEETIVLLDGKVLDGRNRWEACELVKVKPRVIEATVEQAKDPIGFVLSKNLHRRHMTPSQLSMVAARARDIYDRQAKEREHSRKTGTMVNLPESSKGTARDAVGKAMGVSGRSVDYATRVIEKGVPELVKAVDEGRMAVSTAAILASELPEKQIEEVSKPGRNRSYKSLAKAQPKVIPEKDPDKNPADRKVRGVGIDRANEAINCLTRIPKNDALRPRGFQLVTDWIRLNK